MKSTLPSHRPNHRHRLLWLRPLLALIAAMGIVSPVGANTSTTGTVQATYAVNIRACATLDCQVIGSAKLGQTMEITGDLTNGFYPVRWYGREGFVISLYLSGPDDAPWFVEGHPSCNQVALVFNIGIGDQPSQAILDTLIEHQVPATMFPMGWWASEHPDFLRQIADAGFVIGTHGDQPLNLTSATDEAIHQDVTSSIAVIESVIGREIDQYFTPYAADSDARVRDVVSDMGLLPVGWNISANDYGPDATENSVLDRVMSNIYPGAIIEMHLDGPATESSTALALPRIISELQAQGYDLVTVPDLVIPCDEAKSAS
jgi:peptidoglycan/xylan/chitin deacetylase (PgdA/CDA1 family)